MSTLREDQKVSLGSNLLYQAVRTEQREVCTYVGSVLYVFSLIITAISWVCGKTLLTGVKYNLHHVTLTFKFRTS